MNIVFNKNPCPKNFRNLGAPHHILNHFVFMENCTMFINKANIDVINPQLPGYCEEPTTPVLEIEK